MKDKAKPSQTPEPDPAATPVAETAFDVWLNRGLHQLFDDIANEPIPDELLRLIQEDRKK
ncbi:MAG: NepR family anti-sigma factor [Janthinobacterium lividum]